MLVCATAAGMRRWDATLTSLQGMERLFPAARDLVVKVAHLEKRKLKMDGKNKRF